jgi:hypothetical protein
VGRVFLDFLPELVYYNAQVFRLLSTIWALNRLQKPLMRKCFPLLQDENTQNLKLLGTEVNSLTAHINEPFLEIDAEFRGLSFRERLARRRSPKSGSDAGEKFADCKRFHDVVVCSRIEGENLVLFGISDCP